MLRLIWSLAQRVCQCCCCCCYCLIVSKMVCESKALGRVKPRPFHFHFCNHQNINYIRTCVPLETEHINRSPDGRISSVLITLCPMCKADTLESVMRWDMTSYACFMMNWLGCNLFLHLLVSLRFYLFCNTGNWNGLSVWSTVGRLLVCPHVQPSITLNLA